MADERVRLIIDGDADGAVRAAGQAKRAVDGLGTTTRSASRHANAFAAAQREQARTLGQVGRAARNTSLALGGLAGAGAVAAIRSGIKFNAQLETNKIALDQLTGSAKTADKLLGDLFKTARKTPFEFADITEAAKKFLAFGFSVDATKQSLDAIGNATAALGGGAEKINRLTIALGQIKAKGRVQGDELLQLAEAGVPAYTILQEKLNLSAKEVANIGEQGIKADVAIRALTEGMNERFGGMTRRQAQSWNGMVSTMRDDWSQLTGALTEGLFEEMKEWAPAVDRTMTDITEIWKRDKLTLDEKFDLSRGVVEKRLGPLFEEAKTAIEKANLDEKLVDAVDAALPKIAEGVGKAGLMAAQAFGKAFIEADPIGKLILGAYVGKKTGALAGIGKLIGGGLGKGGLGGGISRATPVPVLVTNPGFSAPGDVPGRGSRIADAAKTAAKAVVPVSATAGVLAAATSGGVSNLKGAQDIIDRINRSTPGARDRVKALEEAIRHLHKEWSGPGKSKLDPEFGKALQDLERARDRAKALATAFEQTRSSAGQNLSDIRRAVRLSSRTITQAFGPDTAEAKAALSQNFQQAAAAVERSMRRGRIATSTGLAEIDKLFRQALGEFGIKTLNTKPKDLPQLTAKPPKGAAHGFIGAPGAAGRDVVPLMVGEGEAVLNRHQQAVVDGALAAQGIGGLPELFQKVQTPHYMAKGGIVGLGRSLQARGFQVGEHPAFGGVTPGVHNPRGRHPIGQALDVNADGRPGGEARWLDMLAAQLRAQGWNVLWRVKDHFDHLHVDTGTGGGGLPVAQLKRVMFPKGMGSLSKLGQAGLDRVRAGAQSKLDGLGVGDMGATGLGGGGMSKARLKALWVQAGGDPKVANLMAAIALAESGGNPGIQGPLTRYGHRAGGLWQIHPPERGWQNPLANARMAVRKYGSQGLSAWEAYTNGNYRQFLARGGFAGAAKGKPAKGPRLTAKVTSRKGHLPSRRGQRLRYSLPLDSLRQIDGLGAQIDDAEQNRFPLMVRRHDLTDEQQLMTIADPKTGEPIEVRDEAGIATHTGELSEQRGLKIEISHLIARQQAAAKEALGLLHAGIRERQEALKALRDKIKRNLSHIAAWKDAINRRRQKIRELRRQLQDVSAERAPGKETRKQRAARLANKSKRQDGLRDQIRGIEDEITGLDGKIRGAENLNTTLTTEEGDKERQIGVWTQHRDDTQQLSGRLPNDMSNVMLDIAEIDKRIGEWSGTKPPPVQAPAAPSPDASGTDSQLAGLLSQQLDEQRRSAALARAQLGAFRDFAPLAAMRFQGAFLHGGRIKETGIARVHRDEFVVPDPEGPMGNALTSPLTAQSAPPVINLYVQGDIGPLMGRVRAEIDGRAANVVSQQLGRRSRLITSAAGGR